MCRNLRLMNLNSTFAGLELFQSHIADRNTEHLFCSMHVKLFIHTVSGNLIYKQSTLVKNP